MVSSLLSPKPVPSLAPRGNIEPGPAPRLPRSHAKPQSISSFGPNSRGAPSIFSPYSAFKNLQTLPFLRPHLPQPPTVLPLSLHLPLSLWPPSPTSGPRLNNLHFPQIPFWSSLSGLPQRSPVASPDGSLSFTNPGSIPDTLLSLGCRCPRNSPLLSLSSCSPPRSEWDSPDPPPSRRPSRRRSPGPSATRRSEAPRAAEAEPGEGSQSGSGGGGGCAQA